MTSSVQYFKCNAKIEVVQSERNVESNHLNGVASKVEGSCSEAFKFLKQLPPDSRVKGKVVMQIPNHEGIVEVDIFPFFPFKAVHNLLETGAEGERSEVALERLSEKLSLIPSFVSWSAACLGAVGAWYISSSLIRALLRQTN